jgi:vancomycin resistance protein YoaR
VVVLALAGFIFDITSNFGKIHKGVTMQGIELGGLTQEEAAVLLQEQLSAVVDTAPVDLFANEQLANEGATDEIVDLAQASTTYSMSESDKDARSWRITSATVNASVDGAALAEQAYAVGRGKDFFAGRAKASLFGVDLNASLIYAEAQLADLESLISGVLGWQETNADISFEDGSFVVVPSAEGHGVDHSTFTSRLDQAFLGTKRTSAVPMTAIPVIISDEQAARVAAATQEAIAEPVTLHYEQTDDSWSLDASSLGPWVVTSIEQDEGEDGKGGGENGEDGAARLVPSISESLLREGIHDIVGDRDPGIQPQDARFEATAEAVSIIPSADGIGIDYTQLAADLTQIVFAAEGPTAAQSNQAASNTATTPSGSAANTATTGSTAQDRRVALTITTLEPTLTTAQAEAMHITEKLASYTTEYTVASGAKVTNIHLAAELLNNSLIESGGVWSFNDTAGECNAERGFQEATSIVEGEYVDEIGGGICQVATTVYNAVFDSGLPIAERVNHGFYLVAYPAGRDATVSWRWPDLKFENDTENWVLLAMSYTDSTVTCTLWGTNPGYMVVSEDTGFTDRTDFETKRIDNPELSKGEERIKQEGVRGRTIIVTRYVYNSAGELLRKTDFKSVYEPEKEIIEVGTREDPQDDEAASDSADDESAEEDG